MLQGAFFNIQFLQKPLQSLIDQLPINIKLWNEEKARPSTNKLTCAILTTVVRFAESINEEKAMLLSNACAVFIEAYTGETDIDSLSSVILEIENSDSITKFTSRWLLHQLILHLKPALSFKCIHKKYGTILYRTNGNLLTSLSWALGVTIINRKITNLPVNQHHQHHPVC